MSGLSSARVASREGQPPANQALSPGPVGFGISDHDRATLSSIPLTWGQQLALGQAGLGATVSLTQPLSDSSKLECGFPLTQASSSGSHTQPLGELGETGLALGGFHCLSRQQEPPRESTGKKHPALSQLSSQPSAVGSWTKAVQAPCPAGVKRLLATLWAARRLG